MGPAKAECVRTAFRIEGVRPDGFDLNDRQVTREDWKIHRALSQCDALVAQKKAWGDQNPKGFACTLAKGLKTQCEGYYTASVNGKVQTVPYDTAVQLHLNGVPIGSGVREVPAAQTARARRVQAEQARVQAEAAAQAKAEEDARSLAIRQAEEARLAAIKAKKDKEAADHAEKIAVIERVEQEQKAKRNWLRKKLDRPGVESVIGTVRAKRTSACSTTPCATTAHPTSSRCSTRPSSSSTSSRKANPQSLPKTRMARTVPKKAKPTPRPRLPRQMPNPK